MASRPGAGYGASVTELWAAPIDDLPPERTRHRWIIALVMIVGLVTAGWLIVFVGYALGSAPAGGCGGG
jgi:hypothetical protein